MAVKEIKRRGVAKLPQEFIGLSTDTKPTTDVPVGSTFYEADTKNGYIWDGSAWNLL